MKRSLTILPCIALIFLLALSQAHASNPALGQVIEGAMSELNAAKSDAGLLVLTNAPFVKSNGKDSLPALAQVQEATGAAVGKGNLLFFQRSQSHALRIMLFNKSDRKAVVISRTGKWSVETIRLDAKTIQSSEFWKTAKEKYTAGKDLFTLATLATAWAEGAPYDFLKAAELHNHICPGLTSGYLMAHYMLKHYPLAPGQRYTVVACPVWCKEDAFQAVMDCTPGKRGLVVKPLSAEQKEKISVDNPAGFLLVWDSKKKTGKGVALSFDFKTLKSVYPENTPKAATILYTAAYLSFPDKFVSAAAEFDLDESTYNAMRQAGSNPYKIAGLTKP
ncbi:MAG: hypothetical protein HUN04_10305 [Desulfobacter sp.]|nr:MAG: hypothetical protein HUN04_10305 [Desulfobacter sp.]